MSSVGITMARRTWAKFAPPRMPLASSIAYEYQGWQHGWSNVETSEQLALGKPTAEWPGGAAQGVSALNCGGMYDIPNLRLVNHKLPVAEYLKGGWLRSPLDLSFSFASEQAIDQLAYMLNMDPYEFRRRNIKDPRWLGVLEAVAQAAKWKPSRAASKLSGAKVVTGTWDRSRNASGFLWRCRRRDRGE